MEEIEENTEDQMDEQGEANQQYDEHDHKQGEEQGDRQNIKWDLEKAIDRDVEHRSGQENRCKIAQEIEQEDIQEKDQEGQEEGQEESQENLWLEQRAEMQGKNEEQKQARSCGQHSSPRSAQWPWKGSEKTEPEIDQRSQALSISSPIPSMKSIDSIEEIHDDDDETKLTDLTSLSSLFTPKTSLPYTPRPQSRVPARPVSTWLEIRKSEASPVASIDTQNAPNISHSAENLQQDSILQKAAIVLEDDPTPQVYNFEPSSSLDTTVSGSSFHGLLSSKSCVDSPEHRIADCIKLVDEASWECLRAADSAMIRTIWSKEELQKIVQGFLPYPDNYAQSWLEDTAVNAIIRRVFLDHDDIEVFDSLQSSYAEKHKKYALLPCKSDARLIIMPVHSPAHWSLLVFEKPSSTLIHYDVSFTEENKTVAFMRDGFAQRCPKLEAKSESVSRQFTLLELY